jgi:hypothetical protein
MAYQVVRCPKCDKPQLTTAKKAFGCKYCGRSSGLRKMSILFSSNSHAEALRFLYGLQSTA